MSLSAASFQAITVKYATANGTAVTSSDYTSTTGTLTFAPGETTKPVPVPTRAESTDEFDETFTVALSLPTNATIADGSGTGTILDDDPEPTVTVIDKTVVEGSGSLNAVFRITLTGSTSKPVTVTYSTADGTAAAPGDYTAATGTVTLQSGFTNVTVVVKEDALDEIDENFFFNITATNATVTDGQGVGTITDNDPAPAISITDATVAEPATGTTNASFNVSLSSASGKPVTVVYATADGSAVAPGDYAAAGSTLTFNPARPRRPSTWP